MSKINDNLTALLYRNIELFAEQNTVFCGEIQSEEVLHIAKVCKKAYVFVDSFIVYSKICALLNDEEQKDCEQKISYKNIDIFFMPNELFLENINHFDNLVIYLCKNKTYNSKLLSILCTKLCNQGHIYIAGANNAGGKSADKLLQNNNTVYKVDSAKKSTLFALEFDASKEFEYHKSPSFIYNTQIENQQIELKLKTSESLFSKNQIDEATDFLLRSLKNVKANKILDCGCGSGVIGLAMCKRYKCQADLIDINVNALNLAKLNAKANDLENYVNIYPEDMSQIEGKYDLIISNPPFHEGVSKNTKYTLGLFAQAVNCLNEGGKLIVVANCFLKYEQELLRYFKQVQIINTNNRFNVIMACI